MSDMVLAEAKEAVTLDRLAELDGMFVGQLDAQELEAFEAARARGWCLKSYEGAAGFFGGLGKVRMTEAGRAALNASEPSP